MTKNKIEIIWQDKGKYYGHHNMPTPCTCSPVSYTETYDVHADRWYAHPDMEDAHPRAYHALVSLEGLIYMLGG